jgi:thiol-disulfide isomerase/thioredoxin
MRQKRLKSPYSASGPPHSVIQHNNYYQTLLESGLHRLLKAVDAAMMVLIPFTVNGPLIQSRLSMDSVLSLKRATMYHRIVICIHVVLFILLSLNPVSGLPAYEARLPSQIFKNVEIMRKTDFSSNPYSQYINVEDDVKQYIKMELERIETLDKRYEGDELYYLGFLYSEIGELEKSIPMMKSFLDQPGDIEDASLVMQGTRRLTEILIRHGDLAEAAKHLSVLEKEEAPFLELLLTEMAKGYAAKGDRKKTLFYARKVIKGIDRSLIGLFLDPMIAQLIAEGMIDGALDLLKEIKTDDHRMIDFLEKRKTFLKTVQPPLPEFPCNDFLWIEAPPTSETIPCRNKVSILYFWAGWSDPCKVFAAALNRLQSEHGPEGLMTLGVTKGSTEPSSAEDEADDSEAKNVLEQVRKFYDEADMLFPSMVDQDGKWDEFNLSGEIPFILVVDGKGNVRFYQGSAHLDIGRLEKLVLRLIKENISRKMHSHSSDKG